MFFVTAKVGLMFAVYDDSDNTVEWYNKKQLDEYLGMGVQIQGYSTQGVSIVDNISVPFGQCNWTKSRKDIFEVRDKIAKSDDSITVFAESKKYKGKILGSDANNLTVKFSNGLTTNVPVSIL